MGMLLRQYHPKADEAEQEAPKRKRKPRKGAAPIPPAPQVSAYDELTDDQVGEAYATNVGGEAAERDAQVAELVALDSDVDNGGFKGMG